MNRAVLALLLFSSSLIAAEESDPRAGAVPLPARSGWKAQLALDRGETGIWTVKSYPVFDSVGSDEIVALDDEGRLTVLIPYSGRWTPLDCIAEGSWLGGLAHGDFDPEAAGRELYVGGRRGNLWQVIPHAHGTLEARLVAHLEGREIHTIVLDDLEPDRPGLEMVFFTWPGGLYRVARGEKGPAVSKIGDLPARIRDAVVLPGPAPRIATVSRGGELSLLEFRDGRPNWREVLRVKSGFGRIARRGDVLYAVCDDGRVFRLAGEKLEAELIYAGPLGMRGVVAGRFHEDPDRESIAVFGYSGKVELLTRNKTGWEAETIFEDRDKGHWICTAEFDGRNATDEIVCCGYGGRVVVLYRPPGYGRAGVAATAAEAAPPIRVGFATVRRTEPTITPLVYFGGFRAKTLVYETLVRCDDEGRLVPGLAERWERLDGGKRYVFTLRDGARFHDGTPCDAEAVVASIERWRGKPEHDWLPAARLLTRVRALGARRVECTLSEPYPLERSLAAINPTAVEASADEAIGSGPFRVLEHRPLEATLLERVADGARVELRLLQGGDHLSRTQIRALKLGEIDIAVDGWVSQIPRDEAAQLAASEEFTLVRVPGTVTLHLVFGEGVFAKREARRRLAAALDRAALANETAAGFARPAPTLFGGSVRGWPTRGAPQPAGAKGPALTARLLVYEFDPDLVRLARAVARQAAGAGIAIDVDVATRTEFVRRRAAGDYELLIDRTHRIPYDPHLWLASRFLQGDRTPESIRKAIRAAWGAGTDAALAKAYGEIERRIADEAWVVPLLVPDRIALVREGIDGFRLPRCGYYLDLSRVRSR